MSAYRPVPCQLLAQSGQWPSGWRPLCANRRHRACTPLDSFLSEDLVFTRKGQSEHDFSCGDRYGRLSTPCLRT